MASSARKPGQLCWGYNSDSTELLTFRAGCVTKSNNRCIAAEITGRMVGLRFERRCAHVDALSPKKILCAGRSSVGVCVFTVEKEAPSGASFLLYHNYNFFPFGLFVINSVLACGSFQFYILGVPFRDSVVSMKTL